MKPAPERLEADHPHIARAHQRLEISLDVAVLDRGAQLLAQHHAALARTAELFSEVPAAPALSDFSPTSIGRLSSRRSCWPIRRASSALVMSRHNTTNSSPPSRAIKVSAGISNLSF